MVIRGVSSSMPQRFINSTQFVPVHTPGLPLGQLPSHLIAQGAGGGGSSRLAASAPRGVSGTPPAGGGGDAGDRHTLTNGILKVGVKNAGAELTSLWSERTGLMLAATTGKGRPMSFIATEAGATTGARWPN